MKHNKFKILSIRLLAILLAMSLFTLTANAGKRAPANTAPVITNGTSYPLTIQDGVPGSFVLNSTDKEKNTVTWAISKAPLYGSALFSSVSDILGVSSVTVTYTNSVVNTTDSFIVSVTDSIGAKDTILISVTINHVGVVTQLNYVALGDSIATGTVYPGKVNVSYVHSFYDYLKSLNSSSTVVLRDLVYDGDTSSQFLNRLNTDTVIRSALATADVVTISIGGNNLMQAARNNSIVGYDFFNISSVVAESGRKAFETDWPQIVQLLNDLTLNPNCKIIVNTIYNPYRISTNADLHTMLDGLLSNTSYNGVNDMGYKSC